MARVTAGWSAVSWVEETADMMAKMMDCWSADLTDGMLALNLAEQMADMKARKLDCLSGCLCMRIMVPAYQALPSEG